MAGTNGSFAASQSSCGQFRNRNVRMDATNPRMDAMASSQQRCLWIHGIPGARKTVLMSYLVEKTREYLKNTPREKTAYVYYYCYFGHNQDEAIPLLRWILNQLCRQADIVPSSIHTMFKLSLQPSTPELLKAVVDILDRFDIVYILIDAIDESNDRENILSVLRDLVTGLQFDKIQLLASSREYIDIEEVIQRFSTSISMANPYVEKDIRAYVHSCLKSNPKFERWPGALLEEVENKLSSGAKGMCVTSHCFYKYSALLTYCRFRWAVCQIDILQRFKVRTQHYRKNSEQSTLNYQRDV